MEEKWHNSNANKTKFNRKKRRKEESRIINTFFLRKKLIRKNATTFFQCVFNINIILDDWMMSPLPNRSLSIGTINIYIRGVFKKYCDFYVFSKIIYFFMNIYFVPVKVIPMRYYTLVPTVFPIFESVQKIIFLNYVQLLLRCHKRSVTPSFHRPLQVKIEHVQAKQLSTFE